MKMSITMAGPLITPNIFLSRWVKRISSIGDFLELRVIVILETLVF